MEMIFNGKEDAVDRNFEIGMSIKFLEGVGEILLGLLLLIVNPRIIMGFLGWVFGHERLEDPQDLIMKVIFDTANLIAVDKRLFFGLIILGLGILKLVLVIAVLRKKIKFYLIYEWVLGLFIVYQTYKFYFNHRISLLVLNVIDVFVMIFVYLEYKKLKKRHEKKV